MPITSLFPYTTLFRSWKIAIYVIDLILMKMSKRHKKTEKKCLIYLAKVMIIWQDYMRKASIFVKSILEVQEMMKIDRKSTRLNSSHVAISYAVFCLKK